MTDRAKKQVNKRPEFSVKKVICREEPCLLRVTRIDGNKEFMDHIKSFLLLLFCNIMSLKKLWARLAKFCYSSPIKANMFSLNLSNQQEAAC